MVEEASLEFRFKKIDATRNYVLEDNLLLSFYCCKGKVMEII